VSESAKNLPISILRRLRNKAQAEGRNAQDLLHYYAIEAFVGHWSSGQSWKHSDDISEVH
jgi:ABC-type branched-subunit amino acid transport system substrate-binding protein